MASLVTQRPLPSRCDLFCDISLLLFHDLSDSSLVDRVDGEVSESARAVADSRLQRCHHISDALAEAQEEREEIKCSE